MSACTAFLARARLKASSNSESAKRNVTAAPSENSPMAIAPATATVISTFISSASRRTARHAFGAMTQLAPNYIVNDGTVPRTSMWLRNWTQAGLNNFRQNAPGSGVAGASPDLTIRTATVTCIPGGARVAIDVCNRGTEPVARGLRVAVYGGNPPSAPGCSAATMFNLVVGQCATVSCDWPAAGSVGTVIVDDDGTGMGGAGGASQNLECREDNNRFVLTGINCPLGP